MLRTVVPLIFGKAKGWKTKNDQFGIPQRIICSCPSAVIDRLSWRRCTIFRGPFRVSVLLLVLPPPFCLVGDRPPPYFVPLCLQTWLGQTFIPVLTLSHSPLPTFNDIVERNPAIFWRQSNGCPRFLQRPYQIWRLAVDVYFRAFVITTSGRFIRAAQVKYAAAVDSQE